MLTIHELFSNTIQNNSVVPMLDTVSHQDALNATLQIESVPNMR